jgi:hypothetical protein
VLLLLIALLKNYSQNTVTLEKYKLCPELIYNTDESGFSTVHTISLKLLLSKRVNRWTVWYVESVESLSP